MECSSPPTRSTLAIGEHQAPNPFTSNVSRELLTMPGICGIFDQRPSVGFQPVLDDMVSSMVLPDSGVTRTYINDRLGVGVGWVGQEGSFSDCMPAWNETRNVCLMFFGEDASDEAQLRELKTQGHEFDSANASYLIHLYEEYGLGFLLKLSGWFSGLLVDLRQQMAVLFNDRYGLQRIYCYQDSTTLHFASEAKALLRVLPQTRHLDLRGLTESLSCGCVLQNRSIFSDITLLPGGTMCTLTPGRPINRQSYFQKEAWENQDTLTSDEYYQRLRETFTRILPKYFRNPNSVGMSMTGGLDGRMIMAWANRPPGSLPCYTFGGVYRDCTDVQIARRVAETCGQFHRVIPVDNQFLDEFPKLAQRAVCISDGAMDVTGSVELYVNQIARQIAPIRMTGNYGSEILRANIAFKAAPLNAAVFSPEFVALGEKAAATYVAESAGHPVSFIAFKQVPWHHYSRLSVEQSQLTLRSPYLDNELVALAYQAPRQSLLSKTPSLRLVAEGNPALAQIPTDRGVVYRPVPLVSKVSNLYQELTFRAEYAYDYGMPQALAKIDRLLAPLHLEKLFLGRHKFYHFRVWYRDKLGDYLRDMLLARDARSRQYLRPGILERMIRSHLDGRANFTSELHQILTVELIHRYLLI